MTFEQAQAALNKWTVPAIKPGLARTKLLLKLLDHPDNHFPIIQIAGTNGKGSVAAMLSSILSTAGYKTGRFTSPHLIDERERICINQRPISKKSFIKGVNILLPALKSMKKRNKPATIFEAWTALAAIIFYQNNIDIAVVEVGLGGRYDATTALKRKVLTLITNIQLDHTEILGKTKQSICFEKMGITKKGIPLLTSEDSPKIRLAIKKLALIKTVPVFFCGTKKQDQLVVRSNQSKLTGTSITIDHDDGRLWTLTCPLIGHFQVMNMALAVMAAKWLISFGLTIYDETIEMGLQQVSWPGRLELIHQQPRIILDGGHNPAAIEAVLSSINPKPKQLKLVIGMMKDKAINEVVQLLSPYVKSVWTFKPADQARGLDSQELAQLFARNQIPNTSYQSVNQAIKGALASATRHDTILIIGSLYNIGPAKKAVKYWENRQNSVNASSH